MPTSHAPRTWNCTDAHFRAGVESPWYRLSFKLMAEFTFATYDFYRTRGFVPALVPITSGSVSSPMGLGSDSLPVRVDLFGTPTYLVDSMQFQLEYVLRQGDRGVFYLMPTFRGEDHDPLHLNQFFHSEAEFLGTLADAIPLASDYVRHCTMHLLSALGPEIEACAGTTRHMSQLLALNGNIPRIRFEDACRMLGDNDSFYGRRTEGIKTISREGERALIREFGGFVWLTNMPADSVPFYQAVETGSGYALCADLLFGPGEVVGLGERHVGAAQTLAALRRQGVATDEYEWYLRMKHEYPLVTSGFGLGLERYLAWVLRHDDIRDIHLFSRLRGIESRP
jgi:asparaginyl-tRNA synthetase